MRGNHRASAAWRKRINQHERGNSGMNEDEETMIMGQTIRDLAKAKQKL